MLYLKWSREEDGGENLKENGSIFVKTASVVVLEFQNQLLMVYMCLWKSTFGGGVCFQHLIRCNWCGGILGGLWNVECLANVWIIQWFSTPGWGQYYQLYQIGGFDGQFGRDIVLYDSFERKCREECKRYNMPKLVIITFTTYNRVYYRWLIFLWMGRKLPQLMKHTEGREFTSVERFQTSIYSWQWRITH